MRRLLTTLALLLAFGAPAALPAQAAPFPVAVNQPAAFTSYTTTATVSNASPRQNSTVTVSGTLKSGGKPVAGIPMTATWYYKTTTIVFEKMIPKGGDKKPRVPYPGVNLIQPQEAPRWLLA